MHAFAWPMLIYFLVVMVILCAYGAHRYWLLWRLWRYGTRSGAWTAQGSAPPTCEGAVPTDWPRVTVQLPMFNEPHVAERVIAAAAEMDYPRDRLQIQVLDDSTSECAAMARTCCERLAAAGRDVEYLHRRDRRGYKAGALAAGLEKATGEYIAMFDADFVPPRSFLRQTMSSFVDPRVGLVQARWSHLNGDASPLTAIQALSLDGHFMIEQPARQRSGAWFNFNGTAGVWRREAIDDAGGWTHDTLTEDTDLSYRAQMRGWRFAFLGDVVCPAELPPTVAALASQQHRWSKGLMQCALKLLPDILRSDAPLRTKVEAWFHLTSPLPYLALFMLSLLAIPAFFTRLPLYDWSQESVFWAGLGCLVLGTFAAGLFYVVAGALAGVPGWKRVWLVPLLLAVGVGLCVVNSAAIMEALLGRRSGFVRTPKFAGRPVSAEPAGTGSGRRLVPAGLVELVLGVLLGVATAMALTRPFTLVGVPFLLLFTIGYLAVGVPRLLDSFRGGMWRTVVLRPRHSTT